MKRRALLGSLAASTGALAGCGSREELTNPLSDQSEEPPSAPSEEDEPEWEELRDQFGFDERINAVEDLGWDPNGQFPIEDSLIESFERDALIEVPPGEYRFGESIGGNDVSNWGIIGLGDERTDVRFTTNEGSRFEFKLKPGSDVLLQNFVLDQREGFDRAMGMTLFIEDNLRIYNVEKTGWNPSKDPSGVSALALNVTDPDGLAVVDTFVRTGPQVFRPYPKNELCIFSGTGHEGTVKYRNLQIANAGENGIYASKCPGEVHVEGGVYENNRNDGIRISGNGSYIRNATVIIDSDDFHPDNRGVEGNMRGIRMQSGDQGYSGGVIEDTSLELRSTFRTQSLVHIAHNQGGMALRNSELKNWTEFPTFRATSPSDHVNDPWGVTLENVRVEERGRIGTALSIADRPNSVLRNVTVETTQRTGIRHGINVAGGDGILFEDVTIDTNGIPLRIERPSTPLDDYSIEFKGDNEFSMRTDFGLGTSFDLSMDENRTVFPFRDAAADVDALIVTGQAEDRLDITEIRV